MSVSVPAAPAASDVRRIGVGIDTARYGHHVTFLKFNEAPGPGPAVVDAAQSFPFKESRNGYRQLRAALQRLHERYPLAVLAVHLDVAGQYAVNLERFLRSLELPLIVTVGDPNQNKAYRAVHFPKVKSDPAESHALARFALVELPAQAVSMPDEMVDLRDLASRMLAVSRRQTQHVNQLHVQLARTFPEAATVLGNFRGAAALEFIHRFPTAEHLRDAAPGELESILNFPRKKLEAIRNAAADSVGSRNTPIAVALVRQLVDDVRRDIEELKSLEKLLVEAYRKLPPNHLDTIPGIGVATAAAITAKIIDVARFSSASKVVSYFGVFPEVDRSGLDADGNPKQLNRPRMSRKGNDLVRAYLYNCARSAVGCNDACKAHYARLKARGARSDVAFGHVMARLLRFAHAVWVTGKPFDRDRYKNRIEAAQADGDDGADAPADA